MTLSEKTLELESKELAQQFETAYDILSSLERLVDKKPENESLELLLEGVKRLYESGNNIGIDENKIVSYLRFKEFDEATKRFSKLINSKKFDRLVEISLKYVNELISRGPSRENIRYSKYVFDLVGFAFNKYKEHFFSTDIGKLTEALASNLINLLLNAEPFLKTIEVSRAKDTPYYFESEYLNKLKETRGFFSSWVSKDVWKVEILSALEYSKEYLPKNFSEKYLPFLRTMVSKIKIESDFQKKN